MKSHTRVAVIGGGVVGCSVLYHLTKAGWTDVVLLERMERISGQDCGIHLPGGLMLADTEVRMDFLRMARARGRYLGMDLELITPAEAKTLFPLLDERHFVGALYDPVE